MMMPQSRHENAIARAINTPILVYMFDSFIFEHTQIRAKHARSAIIIEKPFNPNGFLSANQPNSMMNIQLEIASKITKSVKIIASFVSRIILWLAPLVYSLFNPICSNVSYDIKTFLKGSET